MEIRTLSNTYQDSVKLMRIANETRTEFGVDEAVAMMGTQENKDLLQDMGTINAGDIAALQPDDLILAVDDADSETARAAVSHMESEIKGEQERDTQESREDRTAKSLYGALDRHPNANMALISVPGEYATREAWKALHEGLHVHVFSDNVSIEDERRLKTYGRENDLLVMGPDCGTAIVNQVPLGFANSVGSGQIGVVAAAGSGLQEVTALLDRAGAGVSQAIGTGGRDLKDEVGGLTMLQGLEMLEGDSDTEVIVLISKPPDSETMTELLARIEDCPKPVVVEFVGSDPGAAESAGARPATSLADAAREAVTALPASESAGSVSFAGGLDSFTDPDDAGSVLEDLGEPDSERQFVRGLYSGGTLATEAAVLLDETTPDLATNVGLGTPVEDALAPAGNAIIDLGADEFTRSRPHPMIDSTIRDDQLEETLQDSDVSVILMDVILGYGAHEDPAQPILDVLETRSGDAWPAVVTSVVGTTGDPQDWESQVRKLAKAGVYVTESNADAVELTKQLLAQTQNSGGMQQ